MEPKTVSVPEAGKWLGIGRNAAAPFPHHTLRRNERAETGRGLSLPFGGKAGPPSPVALAVSTVEAETTGAGLAPPSSPTNSISVPSGGSGGTGSLCQGELAGWFG
jgi:hypothetical protein